MAEVQQAFGTGTRRRAELFQKLDQFVVLARSFGLFKSLFIDGSFVTDKEAPGDIDAVLELPEPDLAKPMSHPNALAVIDPTAVKPTFEVHLFFQPPPPVAPRADMAQFFSA
jgi:hypothetical protein